MTDSETREVTVSCPKGHLELTVRTTGAIVSEPLREPDPFDRPPEPPHPTVTPEDVLDVGLGEGCPVCDSELTVDDGVSPDG